MTSRKKTTIISTTYHWQSHSNNKQIRRSMEKNNQNKFLIIPAARTKPGNPDLADIDVGFAKEGRLLGLKWTNTGIATHVKVRTKMASSIHSPVELHSGVGIHARPVVLSIFWLSCPVGSCRVFVRGLGRLRWRRRCLIQGCHTLSKAFVKSRSMTLAFLLLAKTRAISSYAMAIAFEVPLDCLNPYCLTFKADSLRDMSEGRCWGSFWISFPVPIERLVGNFLFCWVAFLLSVSMW